jgi:recombination protein RecT
MTNTEQAVVTQKHPIVVLRERLEARAGELKNMTDIPPAKMIRAILTSAQIDPNILACDWSSLWNACARACRDNLLPDGREGAIVAYGSKAQWLPMYQGKLRQFQESGIFKWIHADVVRQGDVYECWTTEDGPHLKHQRGDDGNAPIIRVYAAATTLQGGRFVEEVTMQDIEKIKKVSKAKREDAPWNLWFSEMAKKTALHRLAKMLPVGRIADVDDDDADDEVREDASPLRAAAVTAPRERGAAAALDLFASSSGSTESVQSPPHDSHPAAAPEEGDGVQQTHHESAGAQPDQSSAGPATAAVASTDPIDEGFARALAYERGKEAKAAGHARKTLPGEYRSQENDALATAWLAGWDGKPKPT